jgi:hypothetical protein
LVSWDRDALRIPATAHANAGRQINRTSNMEPKDRVVVASDVNTRDGIGVEIYRNDQLVVEIFRDDTDRTRTITVYTKDISLELMEESIQIFRRNIPWDFIDYTEDK